MDDGSKTTYTITYFYLGNTYFFSPPHTNTHSSFSESMLRSVIISFVYTLMLTISVFLGRKYISTTHVNVGYNSNGDKHLL